MRGAGYGIDDAPGEAAAMMQLLQAGPTNALEGRDAPSGRRCHGRVADYEAAFADLPESVRRAVEARWGSADAGPACRRTAAFVSVCIASATSWSACSRRAATTSIPRAPITIPIWCRRIIIWRSISGSGAHFDAHAVVHLGKHGNLEWLPGKSTGLSANCLPDAVLGPLPHLYPFIVNDPGEGIQAKRRAAAVIIDHLTPPMTRAELHDDLARLETLVDEYALAADLDPKRAAVIAEDILSLARAQRLDADVNVTRETPTNDALRALDAHLCDLKEMQIRDGLHVFGRSPQAAQRNDLLVSIARLPRSEIKPQDASLHRALALDLGLGDFDPLTRDLADRFQRAASRDSCRMSAPPPGAPSGDTVERIELLALRLVSGAQPCDPGWARTRAVLDWIDAKLRPAIDACGDAEMAALLRGLDGRFVRPGRPARRPAAGPTCCRPGAISSRSMSARCRRRRRGGSGSSRPSAWSKAIGRRPANGRAPSRCRPGAPPTCAPAATMSPRRWR